MNDSVFISEEPSNLLCATYYGHILHEAANVYSCLYQI